ncbi:MAG: lysophospholipid acyltransferase family protein [Acidobacteriota bacterium]
MIYYLFRLAGFLCPLVPDRPGYWLCARVGDLVFLLTAKKQRTYFYNLRRVLGEDAPPARVNAVARLGFQNLVKNYFDLFRGHAMTPDKIRAQLAGVEGMEHLQNAMAEGKGVVAGSAHFGSWDMVLQLTAVHLHTEVVVPNERLKPEKLFQYVLALRKSQGIDVVALDVAPRMLIKALKRGHIAGLAFDRDITKTGPVVDFFGKPTQMPDGAVQLSLKYGSPVVIGFSVRQNDNRSYVYIEPPLKFEKTGNLEMDICHGVQQMAAIMERFIRKYPDQWLMFQPFWD